MPFSQDTTMYGRRSDLAGSLYNIAPSQNYVATEILPAFPVQAIEGRIPKVVANKAYRLTKSKRAPGAPFQRISTPLDKATYLCEERGLEEAIDRVSLKAYGDFINQEEVAARTVHNCVAIDHESDVAAAIYNETTFPATGTTGLTVGVSWATKATATPIADINAGKSAISDKIGEGTHALLANAKVIRNIWNTTDVRNAIKENYSGVSGGLIEGTPNLQALAFVLGVEKIIVASARYNSALAGATPAMGPIWSNTYAFLARISDEKVLMTPQLGRTFVYADAFDRAREVVAATGMLPDDRWLVELYEDNNADAEVMRVREFTDEVILDSSAGFLFKSVT